MTQKQIEAINVIKRAMKANRARMLRQLDEEDPLTRNQLLSVHVLYHPVIDYYDAFLTIVRGRFHKYPIQSLAAIFTGVQLKWPDKKTYREALKHFTVQDFIVYGW